MSDRPCDNGIPMRLLDRWKERIRGLKSETCALYLAARHPQTPWYAKLFVALIVAYAFSPIDLIPDFIPILGYLDDLVLIPLAIILALRLIPNTVMDECRTRTKEAFAEGKPVSKVAAGVIIALWVAVLLLGGAWICRTLRIELDAEATNGHDLRSKPKSCCCIGAARRRHFVSRPDAR